MRNICLVVSYDGTAYNGFQSQLDGRTIQDKLERAIYVLTGESIRVNGSGRTDAGVHARSQVVSFHTASSIPAERWALALNARLPNDIVIRKAVEAPLTFHARHDALFKTYRYSIHCSRIPDVFRKNFELHHPTPLDFEAMSASLRHLLGEHDFTSFASPRSTKTSHVRTIYEAWLEIEELFPPETSDARLYPGKQRGRLHLYVRGNGFLYNMVRIIAGTLLLIGEGKKHPDEMAVILAAKDRSQAAPTAPPHALTLWELDYGFLLAEPGELL